MVEQAAAARRRNEPAPDRFPGPAWFRSLVEGAEDAIVGNTLEGIVVSWNPAAEQLFGYSAEEMIHRPLAVLADPGRPGEMSDILEAVRDGRALARYETTRRRKDGRIVPVSLTLSPVRDGQGRVIGASKIARDISERRLREDSVRLHSADVDHRMKNLLTLVLAILRRTGGDSVAAYRAAATGRIEALARANAAIGDRRGGRAGLGEVIEQVLASFRGLGERLAVEGPAVALSADAAHALAMALYELGTNATKHGALSGDAGTARLSWTCATQGLVVRWVERGGPPARAPVHHGLGFAVVRGSIERQLGGTFEAEWAPEGFACTIGLPARHLIGAEPG